MSYWINRSFNVHPMIQFASQWHRLLQHSLHLNMLVQEENLCEINFLIVKLKPYVDFFYYRNRQACVYGCECDDV